MKITPKDYIDAQVSLGRAGFMAIQNMLDAEKSISEVATTYGIDERVVELVKTTSSYSEYKTITRLETERAELETELDEVKKTEEKVKPKTWHYVVASIILVALVAGAIWLIGQAIHFIGGLF